MKINRNINTTIIEVSSEGILNDRIWGLKFDYCVFTNLSHEHLNTHKTMKCYLDTKKKLFNQLKDTGISIINNDDETVSKIKNKLRKGVFTMKKILSLLWLLIVCCLLK